MPDSASRVGDGVWGKRLESQMTLPTTANWPPQSTVESCLADGPSGDNNDRRATSVHDVERTQWKAVRLDEVEAVPWRGSELVWRPVRAALDSRVVGLSAYTASRPGQEIVEDHVETLDGRGHEEVYVVLRGRARFVLDGEEVDASAGMLIAVGPDVKRAAVAIDADTAVLALGGPPDFVPAESEWIDRARPHMNDDPRRARQLIDELRQEHPESAAVPLAEAIFAAARGDRTGAIAWIRAGVAISPAVREFALGEPLLADLVTESDAPEA